MKPTQRLLELGQSPWLDFLDHELLTSGELDRKIANDGLRGMTSNPTIFQKAIAGSSAYDDIIRRAPSSASPAQILERIMVGDITAACDRFRGVYEATGGSDGYVSIEVSPEAARDTERSVIDAHRLWSAVDRPNLLVKIPGTREGLPAIRQCLASGINVNITLLFSVHRYLEVADAYLAALEARVARGEPIDRVASVASFFVSRVDTKVDKALAAAPNALAGAAEALRGQIAIANARIAYEEYERIVDGPAFCMLEARGARPQRLLWASTTPKDPAYHDLYYVEALVGPDTVDTMTRETFEAFLEHGRPETRISCDQALAHRQLALLNTTLAIDFDACTRALEDEGIRLFAASYREAIEVIAEKRRHLSAA